MRVNIGIAIGVVITLAVGVFAGWLFTSINKPTVSERLEACEDAGGRYHYNWSHSQKFYFERCDVIDKEITNY